jgi:hypothetical protein
VSSQVLHHEPTGRIVEAVLKYAAVSNDLQLYSRKEGIFTATETMMVRRPFCVYTCRRTLHSCRPVVTWMTTVLATIKFVSRVQRVGCCWAQIDPPISGFVLSVCWLAGDSVYCSSAYHTLKPKYTYFLAGDQCERHL